jgi:hypothetical protein
MIMFVFLYRPQNVSVFDETLQTRLTCEYVIQIFKWSLNTKCHTKRVYYFMGDIFVAKFEKIIIKEQKIIELELLSCCF